MRALILARIEVLRTTFGQGRFGKPGRKGKLPFGAHYPLDYDFNTLSDEQLVQEFERLVMLCYRQR